MLWKEEIVTVIKVAAMIATLAEGDVIIENDDRSYRTVTIVAIATIVIVLAIFL